MKSLTPGLNVLRVGLNVVRVGLNVLRVGLNVLRVGLSVLRVGLNYLTTVNLPTSTTKLLVLKLHMLTSFQSRSPFEVPYLFIFALSWHEVHSAGLVGAQ